MKSPGPQTNETKASTGKVVDSTFEHHCARIKRCHKKGVAEPQAHQGGDQKPAKRPFYAGLGGIRRSLPAVEALQT